MNNNDIDKMYKMNMEVNEMDTLVSRTIEITNSDGEILSWTVDTRPNDELSSWAVLFRIRQYKEIYKAIVDFLIDKEKGLSRVSIMEKGKDFYWANDPAFCLISGLANIDVYYEKGYSDTISDTESQIDKMREKLQWIDNNAKTYFGYKELSEEIADKVNRVNFTGNNFVSTSVWSMREIACIGNPYTRGFHEITEVRLQEKTETRGYVAYFKRYVLKSNGQMYSQELPMLLVNEVNAADGPGGLVRLMWKHKGKAIIGKVPDEIRHTPSYRHLLEQLNGLYKKEQVLPLLKFMDIDCESPRSVQLHSVTQSMLYWIGTSTSVKEILAKAYGKSGVEGLTKHAFGGFNNITDIDTLMHAVNFVRAFKSMKPQFFEKFTEPWLLHQYVEGYTAYGEINQMHQRVAIEKYLKYFVTSAFINQLTDGTWRDDHVRELQMTVDYFSRIKSTRMRKAIRNHVKRSNFDLTQTFDFVHAELRKLEGGDNKIPAGKYGQYNNVKIGKEIKVVYPNKVSDLAEWGATQNNCIGSYGVDVSQGKRHIFGFKDSNNEWIGHLEISKEGKLIQLLGKHNNQIESEHYGKIIKWLKSIGVKVGSFWGAQ